MGTMAKMEDAAARKAFNAELKRLDLRVHDPDDPPLFTREPQSAVRACHWRWKELGPLFERLGREIDLGSGGQRRTLRLHNPGLPYGTTHTFWASIQYILPNEVASAHRHTANALRFIMHGSGAWTTVDGERYPMNEGDLVLTPSQCWHDHEHLGAAPMIWLDILDISLVRSMHACFFEPYPHEKQPASALPDRSWREFGSGLMRPPRRGPAPQKNPLLAYPRAMSEEALRQASKLEPDPHEDIALEYQNPLNGGPAFANLGLMLQMLRPGVQGRPRRQVSSKLYYVVRGEGATTIEGRRYEWETGDFVLVPPWQWHEHANRSSTKQAVLFQVNDIPAMSALGYYREESK